ncbi:tRNA pseudouridine synthase B [Photobacterium aphoticum]|uniref:tRNA pseudouridine(55) synthase n=1 Tax=Photobacterium aphoticum TaxID=754436 RepID=A0A090RER4_9GAMM|nr:tRNA pseudouridine synthase B [Photobacterium aphoticum]
MARRRKGRPIDGVILLDKPTGFSSNDVLQKVKRIFFAQKAGHTGALDPLATGMLPICFGEATKFSQFLLDSDKRYRVVAKLGERTDTSDSDGEVVETREVKVDRGQLERCIAKFRGTTDQIPSMYSALKYQGRKLYEYAARGLKCRVSHAKSPFTQWICCALATTKWRWNCMCQKAPTSVPSLTILGKC